MFLDHMMLMVQPSEAQQADLDRMLANQQNSSSPDFHKRLSPSEYADRFGLSPADTSRIVAWLESQGFTVNDTGRGRNWIAFSGTAGQILRSLHTSIHRFEVNGEKHFANVSSPELPAAIAGVVAGIQGLHDFNPKRKPAVFKPDYTTTTGTHVLTPEDYATIYNLTPLYPTERGNPLLL